VVDRRIDDDVLRRAVESLRELPPVDVAAVSRIVTSAARIREIDAEPFADDLLPAPRGRMIRWPAVGAIAAAAAVVGYLIGGGRDGVRDRADAGAPLSSQPVASAQAIADVVSGTAESGATPVAGRTPATQAAMVAGDAMPIPTQFVFDGRGAGRVALVGDFNGWDERAAPLVREQGSSLWSVTVPLQPGRHVYAFLVDSVWTIDPHAPKTRDPDFGVTGSVVIVGKP
jgi:hypothetical protein